MTVLSADAAGMVRDQTDITALYREHSGFIGRVIRSLVGPGPHVDDLLQETFVVAHVRRHVLRPDASARAWLYGIAARICMRHGRSLARLRRFLGRLAQHEPESTPPRPDEMLERSRREELVHEVLAKLRFKQREAVALYELEGLSCADIAALLEIPEGTVWTRLHHGRKRFRELLERKLAQEETP